MTRSTLIELPFYESMTRFHNPILGTTVRVWRREGHLPEMPDHEILEALTRLPARMTMQQLQDTLSKIERVSAFELIDRHGNGGVVYLEW